MRARLPVFRGKADCGSKSKRRATAHTTRLLRLSCPPMRRVVGDDALSLVVPVVTGVGVTGSHGRGQQTAQCSDRRRSPHGPNNNADTTETSSAFDLVVVAGLARQRPGAGAANERPQAQVFSFNLYFG